MNSTTMTNIKVKNLNNISTKINELMSIILWFLCLGSILALVLSYSNTTQFYIGSYFKINGFTLLVWTTVTFFSAIVSTYSKTYLNGFKYHNMFTLISFVFTISVMALVASNHLVPFLLSWLAMGLATSRLIGINADWGEARESSKYARRFFLSSSLLLSAGTLSLAFNSKSLLISDIIENIDSLSNEIIIVSALLIITGAIIQSAIFPFHRWLMSAMTAPTPASALMHAGFVNGSGIVLALFATLLFSSHTMEILFVIGGLTAIVAQFTKLIQTTVKQKLACSTVAQMGFMIMQCGLGFFNAAIVHLILHGFYKAYLFLSSGEEIEMLVPKNNPKIKISFIQAIAVLLYGVAGAGLFVLLTGKGNELDSSIFLTLVVAITVGQMTYNIVKAKVLSVAQRVVIPLLLFFGGITVYAFIFNTITHVMSDMPMVVNAVPLNYIHIIFGIIFLIGFFIMKLGVYKNTPWLYVKLLNASQPYKKTVLNLKKQH